MLTLMIVSSTTFIIIQQHSSWFCQGVAAAAAAASVLISQVEADVKNKTDPSASLAALKPALLQVCHLSILFLIADF